MHHEFFSSKICPVLTLYRDCEDNYFVYKNGFITTYYLTYDAFKWGNTTYSKNGSLSTNSDNARPAKARYMMHSTLKLRTDLII